MAKSSSELLNIVANTFPKRFCFHSGLRAGVTLGLWKASLKPLAAAEGSWQAS